MEAAPAPRASRADRLARLGLVAAVALGVAVRASHVLSTRFPLNDGALFYAMTRDIQRAGYHLPAFTSYNGAGIPFGYSPLAFYLAAVVNQVTGLPLIDLFRWLPLAATALTVAAFALLARDMLRSRWALVAAVVAFALVPRSFLWMLMGGGLTRSMGFLFAILTLRQVYRLYTRRRWPHAAWAAALAALTVVSHLGTAPFVAFSSLLLFIAYGRHRHGVLSSLTVAGATVALTAPWWLTVIGAHGLGPFVAALSTGGTIFTTDILRRAAGALGSFGLGTGEPMLSVIGMLAVVGGLASLARGLRLLPAWWVTAVLLDQRAGSTYATLPVAMLAGIGVVEVLLPILLRAQPATRADQRPDHSRLALPVTVLGGFFVFATASALLRLPEIRGEGRDLRSLSADERNAMQWVARTTPAASRFLVIGQTPWEVDRSGEWFPVLAGRVSVATVQGTEWLPDDAFKRKEREYIAVQDCGGWISECLDEWSRTTGVRFTHVYIPKIAGRQCCKMLLHSLDRDPRYTSVYRGPGAQVFADQAAVAALTRRPADPTPAPHPEPRARRGVKRAAARAPARAPARAAGARLAAFP